MNAHYITNKILYDWIAISSTIDSVESIIELIGLHDVQFVETYGFYGYKHRLIFNGIGIHYCFAGNENSVLLEMSGQGCRTFEQYGNADYNSLFKYVLENDEVKISRIDIAYDDFNNYIDLDSIKQNVLERNFISVCKAKNVGFQYSCSDDDFGGAWTVTAGTKGSNIYMRIYDKAEERNATDKFDHWVRCELQLRKSHANQFITFLLGGQAYSPEGEVIIKNLRLDSLYFSVLNHFIRFIDKDANNDTNKWRKPMQKHWEKFACSVTSQRVSLYVKPGVEYNLLRLDHSVEEQYACMIYTYIVCHSVDELVNAVSSKQHKLNVKYRNLIAEHQVQLDAMQSLNERRAELDSVFENLTKDCRRI